MTPPGVGLPGRAPASAGEAEHAVGGRSGHAERGGGREELAAARACRRARPRRAPGDRRMHRLAIDGSAAHWSSPCPLSSDPGRHCTAISVRPSTVFRRRRGVPAVGHAIMRIMKIMLDYGAGLSSQARPDRRPHRQRQVGAGAGRSPSATAACVINADATQVYACWRVLTARPRDDDLRARAAPPLRPRRLRASATPSAPGCATSRRRSTTPARRACARSSSAAPGSTSPR